MDTELFELCKEVYKRTKLGDWSKPDGDPDQTDAYWKHLEGETEAEAFTSSEHSKWSNAVWIAPLYTSDYLLEKLPHSIENDENPNGDNWLSLTSIDDVWCAEYKEEVHFGGKYFSGKYDDTPLKALLKLVIALDDAGVKL